MQQIDRPELQEIYVDSLGGVRFDGQSLRIDGCVTRYQRSDQSGNVTARRYTACRLVLAPAAAFDLIRQLQWILAELQKAAAARAPDAAATSPDTPGPATEKRGKKS